MNRRSFASGLTYAGSVIGAGFATGRELFTYFIRFGIKGFAGIGLCCLIFAYIGYKTLYICISENFNNASHFAHVTMGKYTGHAMTVISFLFLNVLFSGMLSAFEQLSPHSMISGNILSGIFLFVILAKDGKGFTAVNMLLCPLLILGCIFVGIYVFCKNTPVFSLNNHIKDNFLSSAIIYASYNTLTSVSLLTNISNTLKTKKEACVTGFICGVSLLLAGFCLGLPLFFVGAEDVPLPVLRLLQGKITVVYKIVLSSAAITTALSCGHCICSFYQEKLCINRVAAAAMTCVSGVILSGLGFEYIVDNVYYIFGVAGLGQLICIIFYKIGDKKWDTGTQEVCGAADLKK